MPRPEDYPRLQPKNVEMCDELKRWQTFEVASLQEQTNENWDTDLQFRLAREGFFYTGRDRVVECFFCGTRFCCFTNKTDTESEHAILSPNCLSKQYIDTWANVSPDRERCLQPSANEEQPNQDRSREIFPEDNGMELDDLEIFLAETVKLLRRRKSMSSLDSFQIGTDSSRAMTPLSLHLRSISTSSVDSFHIGAFQDSSREMTPLSMQRSYTSLSSVDSHQIGADSSRKSLRYRSTSMSSGDLFQIGADSSRKSLQYRRTSMSSGDLFQIGADSSRKMTPLSMRCRSTSLSSVDSHQIGADHVNEILPGTTETKEWLIEEMLLPLSPEPDFLDEQSEKLIAQYNEWLEKQKQLEKFAEGNPSELETFAENNPPDLKTFTEGNLWELETFTEGTPQELETFAEELKTYAEGNPSELGTFAEKNLQELETFAKGNPSELATFAEENPSELETIAGDSTPDLKTFTEGNLRKLETFTEGTPQELGTFAEGNLQELKTYTEGNLSELGTFADRNLQESETFAKGNPSELAIFAEVSTDTQVVATGLKLKSKFREFHIKRARQSSYQAEKGWPEQVPYTTEQLAECGFYSLEIDDRVKCFSCGVILRNLKLIDDLWVTHARASRGCTHLAKKKGSDFVSAATQECPSSDLSVTFIDDGEDTHSNLLNTALPRTFSDSSSPSSSSGSSDSSEEDNPVNEEDEKKKREDCEQERENRLCKVCCSRPISRVFTPCGHTACDRCCELLEEKGDCHICRKEIECSLEIFFEGIPDQTK